MGHSTEFMIISYDPTTIQDLHKSILRVPRGEWHHHWSKLQDLQDSCDQLVFPDVDSDVGRNLRHAIKVLGKFEDPELIHTYLRPDETLTLELPRYSYEF